MKAVARAIAWIILISIIAALVFAVFAVSYRFGEDWMTKAIQSSPAVKP